MHLKTCPALASGFLAQAAPPLKTAGGGHRGNGLGSSRLPLAAISTNTLRRASASASVGPPLSTAPQGCENSRPRPLLRSAEDADAADDIMTVIRPGHVREKIAIFASEEVRAEGGALTGGLPPSPPATSVTPPPRANKAKGSWEEKCGAKRRRRSGNGRHLQQDPKTVVVSPRRPDGEEEEEQKVSVGDIVAFLEQRVSEQPSPLAPLAPPPALQRSSASITLSRAPPPEISPEISRVSDMVARLESECLQRADGGGGGGAGGVSRSGSLRRTAGRVLLVAAATSRSPEAPCSEPVQAPPPATSGATQAPPPESEPPPGLLFLSAPPPAQPRPLPSPTTPPPLTPPPTPEEAEPLRRRASASQDFLRLRLRLQRLLQPQPYLWALPHHLLLQVLRLLPTRSLAALQCTCSYFKVVMETYGVRPADSRWVRDPRYRDDPCKQCKRRYRRGDVSLCRWHHKPFCQALPGGPGYWMCCRGNSRDAPGCNVGLHDNRWVPSFHSVNAPVRRGGASGRQDD